MGRERAPATWFRQQSSDDESAEFVLFVMARPFLFSFQGRNSSLFTCACNPVKTGDRSVSFAIGFLSWEPCELLQFFQ